MTAAPSMAEVLAEHREDATYPDTCICETEVPDHLDGHYADHLAQALADAGFGHVASVERERDTYREAVEASTRELNDCAFAHGNGRPAILVRLEDAEARLAAVRVEAYSEDAQAVLFGVTGTHPESYGGVTKDEALECAGASLTRIRAALDGEATP